MTNPTKNAPENGFTAVNKHERFQFDKGFNEFIASHPQVGSIAATVIYPQGKVWAQDLWAKQVAGVSRVRVAGATRGLSVSFCRCRENMALWDGTECSESGGGCFGKHETIEGALESAVAFLSRLGGGEIIVYWNLDGHYET